MKEIKLKPFWRYYGGKWRAAPRYPKPLYGTIIEPFAGAAGYSLRYYERNIILIEPYAVVAGIWRYLIHVSPEEILRIPLVEAVDDLPSWVPQEARWLVGFAMNAAVVSPCRVLSIGRKRLREKGRVFEGWSELMRERVASQVGHIRHWKVIEGDYKEAPDIEATWFIDPPYQKAGVFYKNKLSSESYAPLASWSKSRKGQVIVCEAEGADWLPFRTFGQIKSFGNGGKIKTSAEMVWTNT